MLEISKKCISTELLEKRITGIKELNSLIRTSQNTIGVSNQAVSTAWLIEWCN